MKNVIKFGAGLVLTTSMILSPVLALAKNNDSRENKKAEVKSSIKSERKDEKSCLRAFGHFFAKGWLKNNVSYSVEDACFWSFGISKKFGSGNSSTTPDTIAPVITNLTATPRIGEATLTWNTDENSDSGVFFSTTNSVNTQSSSTPFVSGNKRTKNHKVALGNLSAGTTYYAIVRSKDPSGNTSYSSQISFTTKMPDSLGDTKQPVVKGIVTVVSTSTIQVGFRTNEFTTGRVYYSLNSPINASTTTYIEDSALRTNHVIKIPNLSNNTKYYLMVEAKDFVGNVTRSTEFSFTTKSTGTVTPDTTAPVLSAITTEVSSTTITVSWATNETATSKIYYNLGGSIDVNSTTTPFVSNNTLVLSHSLSIPSLATSTQYQVVIESKDASGNRILSPQLDLTTLAL